MIQITIPLWGAIILFIIMVAPSLMICSGMLVRYLNERKGLKIAEKAFKANAGKVVVVKNEKDIPAEVLGKENVEKGEQK